MIIRCIQLSVIVLAAGANVGGIEKADEQLVLLVQDHQRALEMIHEVDIEFEIATEIPNSTNAKADARPEAIWRWSKRDGKERIRWKDLNVKPAAGGRPLNVVDVFQDESTRKELRNWDPHNPQEINPLVQGTVRASIAPSTRSFERDPARVLLFAFSLVTGDSRWTLAELVRDSLRSELLPDELDIGGRVVRRLRFEHPGMIPPVPGAYFEVHLDPRVNYLARKVIAFYPGLEWQSGKADARFIWEVTRFRECGNGVFFPVETEQRNYRGADTIPSLVLHAKVSTLHVNEDLPSDALDFRFPEHAQVVNLPPTNGKARVSIWGPNDNSAHDVDSLDDMKVYLEQYGDISEAIGGIAANPKRFRWSILVLINAAVVGALILMVRCFRKKTVF